MKPRILFIAPLPPPVHGSAMVSQYIKDSKLLQEQYDCDFVNLSTSRRMDEIGKGGIRKVMRFVGAYLTVLGKLMTHRYALCYLAITCHGMGFLKDAPFVLLCKLFRRKVLIHQHNKGMSNCVDRWPYRWLLPLVYRNTTVMLLSWYLYDDIAQVVKREQVVVCPNGIPSFFNDDDNVDDQQYAKQEGLSHTEGTEGKSLTPLLASGVSGEGSSLMAHNSQPTDTTKNEDDNDNVDDDVTPSAPLVPLKEGQCSKHYTLHSEQNDLTQTSQTDTEGKSLTPLLASGVAGEGSSLTANSQPTNEARVEGNAFTSTEQGGGKACVAGLTANSQQPKAKVRASEQNASLLAIFQRAQPKLKGRAFNSATKSLTPNCQPTNEARVEGSAFTSTEQGGGKACVAGLTQQKARLLFLSNLIESKGIYVLLDACKELRERGLYFACDFVGGESKAVSAATFREAIAERGLADCVVYHGPQYGDDKVRFFAQADIFVQPTFDDCFPLTLVEAMQYGLPIVSTDVGAIPDMVKDGENGFVCQQRDVTSLVDALEQLITDDELRTQMGKAGYERYRTTMTLEAFEQRFAEIIRSEAAG